MRTRIFCISAAMISFFAAHPPSLKAQGTAFTYQGQLGANGSPASGIYNLEFSLYTNSTGGAIMAGPVTNNAVFVTNGLFTVAINFGSAVWNGQTNWLQIGVESNTTTPFIALSPRQQITPAPYAIYSANATTLVGGAAQGTGSGNSISASGATDAMIGGGLNNTISSGAGEAFIGGGNLNTAAGQYSMVGAGQNNGASGLGATVAGGQNNSVGSTDGFIGGGADNSDFDYDVVCGGLSNSIASRNSFIGGGQGNTIGSDSPYSGIGVGSDNSVGTASGYSFIGGGAGNQIQPYIGVFTYGFIGGGQTNSVGGTNSAVCGGALNAALGAGSFVGGGGWDGGTLYGNTNAGNAASIAGGLSNDIPYNANYAAIGGGWANSAQATDTVVAGGDNNQATVQAAAVLGGEQNTATEDHTTVGGGQGNNAGGSYAFVGGGYQNSGGGAGDVIGGGYNNSTFNENNSTIGGGANNSSGGSDSFIGGGGYNINTALYAVIGGGVTNSTLDDLAFVGGGSNNVSGGFASMIPGGMNNSALGNFSFAAGNNAQATTNGAFVWSDGTGTATTAFATNQFMARASGGVVFLTSKAASPTSYATGSAGVALLPGATAWSTVSDRNAKKNFEPVDAVALLDKLAAVPIMQWNYKWEKDSDVPNIGPMAQDFKHAFYPGRDDKSISTLEFDGVELAAIQGLNQKLEAQSKEKDAEITDLKQQNDLLAKQLNDLAAAVKMLEQKNQDTK